MFQPSYVLLPVAHQQQRYESDCLAACVDMVLAYYRAPQSYPRLMKVLKVDENSGAYFPDIRKLEQMGITVIYQQGTLQQLHTFLSNGWPVIVPVKTAELPYWQESTDHAVVVVGMDAQTIYLNDPAFATAPIQVGLGDFDLAWLERDEYFAVLAP